MRLSVPVLVFLIAAFPTSTPATPIVFDGLFQTAVEQDPQRDFYAAYTLADAPVDQRSILSLALEVTSTGGSYFADRNETYYQTLVQAAVRLWDSTGAFLGEIFLGHSESGFTPQPESLYGALLLTSVPAVIELAMTGRDAVVDWRLTLDVESRVPADILASGGAVPEPTTLLSLAVGGILVAFQITRTRPLHST